MINRHLFSVAFDDQWGRQMRFITGPRQCGKTTLAKQKLHQEKNSDFYYLWDVRTVRDRYRQDPLFFTHDAPPLRRKQWVCFDEIHKVPRWKNLLKGVFDSTHDHYQFIITGSAKLDVFRRVGDSLSGRFFTFHLFPLLLSEIANTHHPLSRPTTAALFIERILDSKPDPADLLTPLIEYGGFPEPFLKQSKAFLSRWTHDYADTVIKEDIGALTRIVEKDHLYDLYRLLPEFIGAHISESSLATHLQVSAPTIKNHLKRLDDFFLAFKIHPYSKNVKRALLKAPKNYLYNWTMNKNEGARFENFVAVQLKAYVTLWSEKSGQEFDLFYVKNKQKEETDFLITHAGKPWMLIEAKRSDGPVSDHHFHHQQQLGNIPFVQVCQQEHVASMAGNKAYRLSASKLFS